MASEYTTNFNLDLYTDTDKPNLRDQYNGAMRKVDAQLLVNSNNTASALAAAQQANEIVNSLKTNEISAIKSNIAENAESISAIEDDLANANDKITANQSSIETLQSSVSANTSDITKLKTTVASQQTSIDDIFPITSSKIAAGAITRDKLDAQALESIIKGITIRRFDNQDSTADNTGLVVPSTDYHLAGFYLPELTMLVITTLETSYGKTIGSFRDISSAVEFKLPSYVPNPTTNIQINSIGIIYASGTDFKTWTGIGITRTGYVGISTPINSSDNTALAMAGNAVVFLRAFGAA